MADIKVINQEMSASDTALKISGINKVGLYTLIYKEISRFMSVYLQTLIAPAITTLLFYTIFALAFGGDERLVNGVSFMTFLAPGLIMMTMVQNAFMNSSSSLVLSKVMGNIVDILMPPLNSAELLIGFVTGSIARGVMVGIVTAIVLAFFEPFSFHSPGMLIVFALLGTMMLSTMGLMAGIWADKFDHIAAVTNFFITPMAFLSGTFYSIRELPEIWLKIAYINPFFYMIDGFRYGFIGQADCNIANGIAILFVMNIVLLFVAWSMLKAGYKIKS
jgi:ABC-2 type transport system permease protein